MRRLLCHPLSWILVLALGVRFYHLTYHSLWFDEVVSTYWAGRPAGEIWRVGMALVQDKHPPLYYLLLHGWTALVGGSDLAVRSLGALIGALAVLPLYGIGRRLSGPRGAAFAALLLAINPFLVWYSQEARMFMPATAFALVGLYGLLRAAHGAWRTPPRPWPPNIGGEGGAAPLAPQDWGEGGAPPKVGGKGGPSASPPPPSPPKVGGKGGPSASPPPPWPPKVGGKGGPSSLALLLLSGGFAAALYSYLYSAFLLPVAGLWLLMARWTRRGERDADRDFWLGVLGLGIAAVLFLPLAWSAWRVSGAEAVPGRPFEGMWAPLATMLRAYTLGWPAWDARLTTILAAGMGALALLGCFLPADRGNRRSGGLYILIWPLVVILIGGALLSRDSRTFAETRYQIALAPALCVALGRALDRLWAWRRPVGLAAAGLIFATTAAALPYDWAPQNRREAWREAAAFVQAHAGPHDAILIQPDYVQIAFRRYFRGPQDIFVPFTDRIRDADQVEGPLAGLAPFDAVWVVQSHHQELDPNNVVLGWFAARYPLITEVFPPGIAIHVYDQRYRLADLPSNVPSRSDWPALDGVQPLACLYDPAALRPRDDLFHPPSAWIHVTSYWRPGDRPAAGELRPRFRLVDAQGQVWGESMARPNDAFGLWPADRWVAGEIVRSHHDVNLNPVTPRGTYRLILEAPGAPGQIRCGEVEIQ